MEAKNKRRTVIIILITLIALANTIIFGHFITFVSSSRDKEVEDQLSEVYGQLNYRFIELAGKNWNLLSNASTAFEMSDDEFTRRYIVSMKKQWGFDKWLFINENGEYIDGMGSTGYLNMGKEAERLYNGENIVIDGTTSGSDPMMIYAIPTHNGSYCGFSYCSAAILYSKENMMAAMENNSYGGEGYCYLAYPDGRMLMAFQNDEDERIAKNLFTLLKNVKLKGITFEKVREDIQSGGSGCIRYQSDEDHYLYYQPVGFQDWVLVGIVPCELVGRHVSKIMERTALLSTLFTVLAIVGICILTIEKNRLAAAKKNEEIAYRESLFEILSNNTRNMFLVLRPEGQLVEYISSNTEEILGIDRDAAMEDVMNFFASQDFEQLKQLNKELTALPVGGIMKNKVTRRNVKTGETLYYEELAFHASINGTDRFIFLMLDHTEEQQAYERLQTALEVARTANESKSTFLSNMSHDIRTPMNAILGFSPMLKRDADNPEKVIEYSDKIQAAGQHLLGIINDILDMSKIESGKTSLKIAAFSLSEVIAGIKSVILPQAMVKNQNFSIKLHNLHDEILEGDVTKLTQILMNILSNAVKYTPDGGQITMTVSRFPQGSKAFAKYQFVIEDNGIGMSEEFLQHIFDPFSREEQNTAGARGTGLGMAIVKSLVDLMGGYISVQSKKGEGSKFTLDMKLKVQQSEWDDFWQKKSISSVLIVDGSVETCKNIEEAVRSEGLSAEYATDARNALKMVRARHFDIVLIDRDEDDLEPIDTAGQIRKYSPQTIIFWRSDRCLLSETSIALSSGCIAKPFFMSSLRAAIENMEALGSAAANADISGLHILAAEDYPLNSEILGYTLEANDAECKVCENGKLLLEEFTSAPPDTYDLILMDIQMPEMDGYEATIALRSSKHPKAATIPIIAMSANAFTEDIQKAYAAGMNDYLTKPIDVDMMVKTIAKYKRRK